MSEDRTVIAEHKITGAKLIWQAPAWFGKIIDIECQDGKLIARNILGNELVVELKETQ